MTTTRLIYPESLELCYPVVLEDFHIRKGSGGNGEWNAGDGIRRTIRFLEKMECTAAHRPPLRRRSGSQPARNGQPGHSWARRKDG